MVVEIPKDELGAMPPPHWFEGKIVYELGNKKNTSGLYRDWYVSNGADYTCFDWNGSDGAISLDFGKPLPPGMAARADLVTNFGFTEHVFTDQRQAWRNLLAMSDKAGCYVACVLPTPGHWEHHGVYQPSIKWLSEFFELNGFLLVRNYINTDRKRHVNVICAVRQLSPTFHWPAEPIHITKPDRRVNPAEKNCGVTP